MKRALIILGLLLVASVAFGQNFPIPGPGVYSGGAPSCSTTNYNVAFSLTENPISQSGCWVSGHAAGSSCGGFCWGDVQTISSGKAYGADQPTGFSDPTANLTSWGTGQQTVQATVFIGAGAMNVCCKEVELRARSTISSGSISGYEMNCSVANDSTSNTTYMQIVRWNGAHNNFTLLAGPGGTATAGTQRCVNGDTIKLVVTGTGGSTIINGYHNGTLISFNLQSNGSTVTNVPDTSGLSSGSPGMGFYDDQDTNFSNFGFTAWSATSP